MNNPRQQGRRVKFGDIVRLNKDTSKDPQADGLERYVGLEHITPGDLRVRSWGHVAEGTTFTNRFRPGQVLFGKRRAYQRKVAVADFDGVCSGDIYVLEPKDPSRLLPDLLPFICQTDAFFEHAVGTSAGSLSPRTNWRSLADYEIALPSLEQQNRRLPILLAVRESVEAYEDALEKGRTLYDSTLCHLYTRGSRGAALTPEGTPKTWELLPLGDRYEVQLGKMMSKAAREGANQRPYLRNANVQWNQLDLDDVQTMSFSEKDLAKFQLRYGDIVACEGRHVGKSALWRDEIPGACYQKALHRLRRLTEQDDPEFLLHCLRFYSITGKFVAETGETTIPHLPAERLRAMSFPFPPLDEQQEIVEAVREIDEGLHALDERLRNAKALLAALAARVLEAA